MMTLLMVMIIMMFRSVMTTNMIMYADFDYNIEDDKERLIENTNGLTPPSLIYNGESGNQLR